MKETIEEECLEGTEIIWENEEYRRCGLVVGHERGVGITIVNKEDPEDYLTCLVGPLSPSYPKNWKTPKRLKLADLKFDYLTKRIKQGWHTTEDNLDGTFKDEEDSFGFSLDGPSSNFCAFAQ